VITLKSAREIGLMREAGKIVVAALNLVRSMAHPGVKTIELDRAAEDLYRRAGAVPLFKGVQNGRGKLPFPSVLCLSLNEQVVHGIPSDRRLKDGDILSVDTGCKLAGWCADSAATIAIGAVLPEAARLMAVAKATLDLAIQELARQRKWSDVAKIMEDYVRAHGYSVVEQFVGHGIGREMHEEPQVPNFMNRSMLKKDFWLEQGLVIAIEPMVNQGTKEVRVLKDQWTVETKDRRLSAHFEHTVAITNSGIEVLTEGAH
jgi:methionyl aminopeptidase